MCGVWVRGVGGCVGGGGGARGLGADQREDGDVAEDEQREEAYVVVHELVEGRRALLARDELPPGLGLGLGLRLGSTQWNSPCEGCSLGAWLQPQPSGT